jgi:spermidine/putrescine-binding protein
MAAELNVPFGQVWLFDSVHYFKSFATGDLWVAVGWRGDILSATKRLSDVAVIVPQSGTSLWTDVWVGALFQSEF